MFGMGMPEIILILAIALIVLGPKKLPEIAKSLGRGIAEFKKATQDFKENIEVDNDFKEAKDTIQGIKGDLERGVRQSVSGESVPGESVSVRTASMGVQKPQNQVSAETGGAPSEESEAGSSDDDVTSDTAASEAPPPEGDTEEGEGKEKGSARDA
jgi:TatA/E family protein of Tat protein translocase